MILFLLGFVLVFMALAIVGYCVIGTALLGKMAHFLWRKNHPSGRHTPIYKTLFPTLFRGRRTNRTQATTYRPSDDFAEALRLYNEHGGKAWVDTARTDGDR